MSVVDSPKNRIKIVRLTQSVLRENCVAGLKRSNKRWFSTAHFICQLAVWPSSACVAMSDQDGRHWVDVFKTYPEIGVAALIICLVVTFALNFSWWLIALPDLVNAHSDSRLVAAFFGSLGLVLLDTVAVFRGLRGVHVINLAFKNRELTHDDDKA